MTIETVLTASVVRPVHVGFLDIDTDPIRGWTGPGTFAPSSTGDTDLDGETFLSAEGAVEISNFQEDQGIGASLSVTFAAGDMEDEVLFQELVVDQRLFQGRKAKFWLFFLTPDESGVLADFELLFNGIMVSAATARQSGSPSTITIICDQDTQKAKVAPTRWIDHTRYYPADTFSTFMVALTRSPISQQVDIQTRRDRFNTPGTGGSTRR